MTIQKHTDRVKYLCFHCRYLQTVRYLLSYSFSIELRKKMVKINCVTEPEFGQARIGSDDRRKAQTAPLRRDVTTDDTDCSCSRRLSFGKHSLNVFKKCAKTEGDVKCKNVWGREAVKESCMKTFRI
jgi:hypothetical protein